MGANDTELFKEMTHFENLSFLDSFSWTFFIKIFFLIVDGQIVDAVGGFVASIFMSHKL